MIETILVGAGILFMVAAVFICFSLINVIQSKKYRRWFLLPLCMIIFFLAGYILLFNSLIRSNITYETNKLMVSSVYCLGAFFVILILSISYTLIKRLEFDAREMRKLNRELHKNSESVSKSNKYLERAKSDLGRKNKVLADTMEEFYTLRLEMEKSDDKKIRTENKVLGKKISKLKSKLKKH